MPKIDVNLDLQKSTKRTHVYGTEADVVAVKTVYVQQEQLPSPPPKVLTLSLEWDG